MSDFKKGTDYDEEDFPHNWSNEQRAKHINELLADRGNRSVELFFRDGSIVVRVWFVDHLA